MEIPREKILVLFTLTVVLSSFSLAAAAGDNAFDKDITRTREFGCRWFGGSASRLSCNCEAEAEMFIEEGSIPTYSTTEIEISGCKTVRFGRNSVRELTTLRRVHLSEINSIVFDEESVIWYGYREAGNQHEERFDLTIPSLRITVQSSNVALVSSHTFRGRINEITFDNVIVEKMLPIAFANLLQTEKIVIRNSVLKTMDQPFKKFGTEYLELDGVSADIVPSRTFSNVIVYRKFSINNCSFNTVRSGAFSVNSPEIFEVTNSKIGHLSGEAFKISSRGTVLFKDNVFNAVDDGAFRGISLENDRVLGNTAMTFDSNTFSSLTRDSFAVSTSNFNVRFSNIYINESCECRGIDKKIKESVYYADIHCVHDDVYMVARDYKSSNCSIASNYFITIIIVSIVLILLLVVVCGLLVYYKLVYRRKKYGSEKESQRGNLSLIVPDGRTYRETELHVIVEKTDLLTTDL